MNIKLGLGKAALWTKNHAPTLLMIAGTGLEIAAVITAIKDAPKASKAITDTRVELDKCKDARDAGIIRVEKEPEEGDDENAEPDIIEEEYTQKDYARDLTASYVRGAGRLAKATWRPIVGATGSLICFWGAHHLNTKKIIGLTATSSYLAKKLSDYRNRVIEDQGEEKDKEYLYGLKKEKIEVKDEKGKVKRQDQLVIDDSVDHTCPLFNAFTVKIDSRNYDYKTNMNSPIHLQTWLSISQDSMNRIYHTKGWISCAECLDILGINEFNCDNIDPNVTHTIGKVLPKDHEDYIDMDCIRRDEYGRETLCVTKDTEGNIYLTFNFDAEPIIGRIPKRSKRELARRMELYPEIEK